MLTYIVVISLFAAFVSSTLSQPDILQSLGNHGDRLTDLESKMAALTSTVGSLKTDLQRVLNENVNLKQEIQALKSGSLCARVCPARSPAVPSSPTSALLVPTNLLTSTNPNAVFSSKFSTIQSTYSAPVFTKVSAHVQNSSTDASTSVSLTASSLGSTLPSSTITTKSLTTYSTTEATTAKPVYEDCKDAWSKGVRTRGALQIHPVGMANPIRVYCHMTSSDGWIVIQRRINGNVSFDRGWTEYKRGFGEFDGDFWIGNEIIHQLTTGRSHNTLYISLGDWSQTTKHAQYEDFWVDSESEGYRLSVGKYSGNAGDSFSYRQSGQLQHNHMRFTTRDRDNDPHWVNCAQTLHGGWWFNRCYSSNLNGVYLSQPYGHRNIGETYGDPTLEGTGIEWYPWQHKQYSLKFTEMMIKAGARSTTG